MTFEPASKVNRKSADKINGESADKTRSAYSVADYGGPEDGRRNLRNLAMEVVDHNQRTIHDWLAARATVSVDWERLLGLRLMPVADRPADYGPPLLSINGSLGEGERKAQPRFEVHSARISRRTGPDGFEMHLLIAEVVQRRRGYFDLKEQAAADNGDKGFIGDDRWEEPDFWFRGGATLHIDLRDGRLLRILRKRIDDEERLERERAFRSGETTGTPAAAPHAGEPFAFIHRGS